MNSDGTCGGETSEANVHVVIAAFFPDRAHLRAMVERLLTQADHIHVVDNTTRAAEGVGALFAEDAFAGRVSIDVVGDNLGVAAAFNRGMVTAFREGATHVMLSDQDSMATPCMVSRLLATMNSYHSSPGAVAVVGPDFSNEVDERSFRFDSDRSGLFLYPKIRPTPAEPVVRVASVISSGALFSAHALSSIGLMREDLFVDFVDVEWCERARQRGYLCLTDGRAVMQHRMGEDQLRFWLFYPRLISRYGPTRLHYQARNSTYLAVRPGVAWSFRVGVAWFLLGKLYAYGVTRDLAAVKALLLGMGDGLLGRLGRLPA